MRWLLVCLLLALCYLWGHHNARVQGELELTLYKYEQEQNYATLLSEKLSLAQKYAADVDKLQSKHATELREQATQFEATIRSLRNSFKPSGVQYVNAPSDSGSTSDSARKLVCYTESDLRERIAGALVIGARCDKLATDYNALLRLIEAYNRAKK